MILDGSAGLTTPGVVNTAGETIATTLVVTGVTTLTGGLNAALPVLSGGTGVTTKTGTGAVVLGTSPTLTTPTFDSAQLATISGTAPLYMCRAWVNFNGTGTVAIRASGNVSSITDNAVGDYTVNFTTAMPDANYSIVGSANPLYAANNSAFNINSSGPAASIGEIAPTVSACRIITTSPGPTALDAKYINISIFR